MRRNLLNLVLIIVLITSCSSRTKSKRYGAVAGSILCGTLGAYLGKELSPNESSKGFNKTLGLGLGAISCGYLGYKAGEYLYNEDPRNQEGKPIKIIKPSKTPSQQEMLNTDVPSINFQDLSVVQSGSVSTQVLKNIPKELRAKIKKQKIVKYKIKPQIIKTPDGRFLHFTGGEAIEHQYEDAQ